MIIFIDSLSFVEVSTNERPRWRHGGLKLWRPGWWL